jgi:hypothetical protein
MKFLDKILILIFVKNITQYSQISAYTSLGLMVFNTVRVARIEPGVMIEGAANDQWVHIEFGGATAKVFDPDVIAPRYASGELHEVKLCLNVNSVEPSNSRALGIAGNRYYGRVISISKRGGMFEHLLDINGLRVHMAEMDQYPVGTHLSIQGRLDLEDIQLPNPSVWDTI